MRRRGFVMIIALVYAAVLTVVVTAMAYFIASESRGVGFQLDDTKALYLAQAGVERAFREIRDEVLTPPQTGVADLRGADTALSVAMTNPANMCYIDATTYTAATCAVIDNNTDQAIIRTFDSNYTQARIVSVLFFVRASRATGGSGATIAASYTTNGSTYTTAFTQALPNSTTLANYSADITGTLTWATLMSSNFRLRVMRTSGNRNAYIDAIWLRVTYNIDTNTEPWYTESYAVFPMTLGDGRIKTVTITDEARKVHLNTASQALLNYLMQERGIPAATASTIATNIVNYRGAALTNPFDTVEELQQVAGVTSAYYDLIKDYVTVYSYINTNTQRPAGSPLFRAPVNINTAPPEVLRAIFDPIVGTATSNTLANDIITARTTGAGPFTCFYNSNTLVTTDFYDFVMGRGYLTAAQRNQILDNSDASLLVPVSGYAGMNEQTTEFCYADTTYRIESVGSIAVTGKVTNDINLRVTSMVGNDSSRTFPVYANQPQSGWKGYWKESYE